MIDNAADPDGYALALHGGAGTIDEATLSADETTELHDALHSALARGRDILAAEGSALAAVEAAVIALEDCRYFNAGHGACLTWDGDHELDAAIMDGAARQSGAVAGVRQVRNPIRAARAVMEHSDHVLLAGAGADRFAEHCGLSPVPNDYFTTDLRRAQWQQLHDNGQTSAQDTFRFGTVGAVARDRHGHLAAATSTGGVTHKRWGRIGDSPLIGAGTLADDASCAVSCSGAGELFIRHGVAHEIGARLRLAGQALDAAITELFAGQLAAPDGTGGVIAVDRHGHIVIDFNTRGFYRAWTRDARPARTAIEQNVRTHQGMRRAD